MSLADRLKQIFTEFDDDKAHVISEETLGSVLKQLDPSFTQDELDDLFKMADANSNGVIEYNEFVDFICMLETDDEKASTKKFTKELSFDRMVVQEYHAEAAFMRAMLVNAQVEELLEEKHGEPPPPDEELDDIDAEIPTRASQIEKVYNMPRPYTHEGAVGLMNHYIEHGASMLLPEEVVAEMLRDFTEQYGKLHQKCLVEANIPQAEGSQFIVVGDTHGQLSDVLCIFHNVGPPSAKNVFLFNGDIADRGKHAVEIFLLLMAFFLAEPSSIIINRGNHENEGMNQLEADHGGGFYDEVLSKYSPRIFNDFINAFKVLSVCVVIQKEYFVVHGGLTRQKVLTMKLINSIDHKACTCPKSTADSKEDQAFADLLWSDPMDDNGKFRSDRGLGIIFGPDVTEKFLEKNGFRYILRSHQLPVDQRGYQKHHGGRLLTIFSASNYCGNAGNQGAVLVFKPETFPQHEIYEHYAPPLDSLQELFGSAKSLDDAGKEFADSENLDAARAKKEIEKMGWAIVECKPDLHAKFSDEIKGDLVDLDAWAEICSSIMGSALPWKEAAEAWNLVGHSGQISIHNFLVLFGVDLDNEMYNQFKNKAIQQVFVSIMDLDMNLQELFGHFDKDGDGTVTKEELLEVLGQFDLGLAPPQLNSLVRSFFKGPPGSTESVEKIVVDDFLMKFTVTYKSAGGGDEGLFWVQEVMGALARLIMATPIEQLVKTSPVKEGVKGTEKMRYMFEDLDTSKDGLLQIEEFVDGVAELPGIDKIKHNDEPLTKETLVQCAKAIDSSESGTINYLEFLQAFSIEDQDGDLTDMLADQITTVLFRHRQAVRTACRFFDSANKGRIKASQFQSALECVSDAIAYPEAHFTSAQIELLVEAVAGEKKVVNYEEFLRSFRLIMIETGEKRKRTTTRVG